MLKRLRLLYSESTSALEASGTHSHGKLLFDNSTKEGQISPVLVKTVTSPKPMKNKHAFAASKTG